MVIVIGVSVMGLGYPVSRAYGPVGYYWDDCSQGDRVSDCWQSEMSSRMDSQPRPRPPLPAAGSLVLTGFGALLLPFQAGLRSP